MARDADAAEFLGKRARWSQERRSEISAALNEAEAVRAIQNLAIYVCGSLGRDEANEHSDLDLFEMVDDTDQGAAVPNVQRYPLYAQVISTHTRFKYDAPSNDGQFLDIHSLKRMLEHLGGPLDDYENEFTARMLLLLESQPLFGGEVYDRVVKKIVDAYFRDYPDHKTEFRPVFLLNDVMRYWKTLCLNYEFRRNPGAQTASEKAKHSRKNVKLKFSRLVICFSMVVPLASGLYRTKEEVVRLVKLTPLSRLDDVAGRIGPKAVDLVKDLKAQYVAFLEMDGDPDFIKKLEDRTHRERVFDLGNQFADAMFTFLLECAPPGSSVVRYVVV